MKKKANASENWLLYYCRLIQTRKFSRTHASQAYIYYCTQRRAAPSIYTLLASIVRNKHMHTFWKGSVYKALFFLHCIYRLVSRRQCAASDAILFCNPRCRRRRGESSSFCGHRDLRGRWCQRQEQRASLSVATPDSLQSDRIFSCDVFCIILGIRDFRNFKSRLYKLYTLRNNLFAESRKRAVIIVCNHTRYNLVAKIFCACIYITRVSRMYSGLQCQSLDRRNIYIISFSRRIYIDIYMQLSIGYIVSCRKQTTGLDYPEHY